MSVYEHDDDGRLVAIDGERLVPFDLSLPSMRRIGLPEQELMECQHCGMVMSLRLLSQIAHSNHCPPVEVNAGRGDTPSTRGADDAPDEAKGERASHSQERSPASAVSYLSRLRRMTADPVLQRRVDVELGKRQAPEIGLEPHPVHGGNPRPWFIAGWAILCAFIVIGLGLVLGWWR